MFAFVISCTTIVTCELLIRKSAWAWVMGLGNQGLWIAFAVVEKQYGLLPLSCFLVVQNVRGLLRWSRAKDEGKTCHNP